SRMHPQSLSTLAEERREDDEGLANAPLSSSSSEQQRAKGASRLSLVSWFGFSSSNGNGREERSWRPLGSRAARSDEESGGAAAASSGGRPAQHLSHRHLPSSSSSSFSSSRTSVSTAPPALGGGAAAEEGRHFRVHLFSPGSACVARNERSQQEAEQRGAALAAQAAAANSKKNRGVLRFSGRLPAILGGGRLRLPHQLQQQAPSHQSRRSEKRKKGGEGGSSSIGGGGSRSASMARRNGSGDSSTSLGGEGETGRLLLNEEDEEEIVEGVEMRERSDSEMEDKHRECPLCFNSCPEWAFTRLIGCSEHSCCCHCLLKYVQLEVRENRVEVSCFECSSILHPIDVHTALKYSSDDSIIARYEEFSVRKCLLSEPDTRWCPAPDCGFAVIAASCAACPQLRCARESCGTLFCYHCKDVWHDSMTCEEARRTRGIFAMSSGTSGESRRGILRGSMGMRRGSSRMSSEAMILKPGDVKSCPRCRALIVKMDDGSCNHMVCAMCSTEFCWLCLKEISDLHYLSPTGCTFWGKKPWTRKKKLAWQLGTLIGAPLGIALIAGLSVPGIIFGVPVLVGRKVHTRFMHHTKLRRRLITAACVAGSLVVSPVLAVMAVGVGVPIMLAYVYGVVPLSLCRNGGCGWSSALMGEESSEEVVWTGMVSEEEVAAAAAAAARGGASGSGLAASSSGDVADGSSAVLGGVSMASGGGAERRGADAGSLAPATSLHSGFSVWTARGKSCGGDSESCSNTAKRQRRPSSESGGVTSLNYEEASTKGLAGSQYHYDDKSVHTLGSQAPELMSCCDDVASTKALAGSVHDTKSLSGSAVVHDVCDEPSTSGSYGGAHHHHHHPHHRSVSSTRQCKSHSLSGCSRGSATAAASAAGGCGDHREGGTLSEDDDEIVHDLTYTAATPTGPCSSSNIHAPFTMPTPTMTPHLSVFAMHAAQAAAATAAASSAAAAASSSSGSSAPTSNPDPFGIRTLLDNMKQMVAADDVDCDIDDVYRPEPQPRPITREPTASCSSAISPCGRGDAELGARPAPPSRQVSSTSTRGSSSSSSAAAAAAATASAADGATPTPARRSVRWLPSFLTKKSKQ
ncbi:hypothetical protein PFISCL1PPCAC_22566, partial [Pristionchus fissidentatus]